MQYYLVRTNFIRYLFYNVMFGGKNNMKLTSVTCPSCGGIVEIDEYSKSFVCKYCGVTSIIEKDSYNFNYNDSRIEKAKLYIKNQQDYKNAVQNYKTVINSDPSDPRPWLGLLECATCDFTQKLYLEVQNYEPVWLDGLEKRVNKYYEQYIKLDKKTDFLASITEKFNEYMTRNKNEYTELCCNLNTRNKNILKTTNSDNMESTCDKTIKAENKIISSEALYEIFELMSFKLKKYLTISEVENKFNENLDYSEKEYTFNDSGSTLVFDVDFYDNTNISINNYDEFINIFKNRLNSIKSLRVHFRLNYYTENKELGKDSKYISQNIYMHIEEKKLHIDATLDSSDDKLKDIYLLIKNTIINAPTKYDKIIKQKNFISAIVILGSGLIPAFIMSLLLFAVPFTRKIYSDFPIVYPILCIVLAILLGKAFEFLIFTRLYENIKPEKKRIGYDFTSNKQLYTDDIEEYINSSEILIGHNSENMNYRNSISKIYNICKKIALSGFILIAIISCILFLLK